MHNVLNVINILSDRLRRNIRLVRPNVPEYRRDVQMLEEQLRIMAVDHHVHPIEDLFMRELLNGVSMPKALEDAKADTEDSLRNAAEDRSVLRMANIVISSS